MGIRIPYNEYNFEYPKSISNLIYEDLEKNYHNYVSKQMESLELYYEKNYKLYTIISWLSLPISFCFLIIYIVENEWKYSFFFLVIFILGIITSLACTSPILSASSYRRYLKKKEHYYRSLKNIYKDSYSYIDFNNRYQEWRKKEEMGVGGRFIYKFLIIITGKS